jgi:formimidoylglutamase
MAKPPREDTTAALLARELATTQVIPATEAGIWPAPPSALPHTRLASRIRTDPADVPACHIALLGLADDLGVRLNAGRAGAAHGPSAFRAALASYGVADPAGIHYPVVFDAGDVHPSQGEGPDALAATHQRVAMASAALVRAGLFPIAIGGGHDLTFPFVQGVINATATTPRPTFAGVYFDAHLDVRDSPGSGMPFRRLIEDCAVGPLLVVGQSTLVNSREHAQWFAAHGGLVADDDLPDRAQAPEDLAPPMEGVDHLFASFDLDAIDMAAAPGVSAMNPQGLSPRQAARLVHLIAQHPRLRCFDLMELSPPHDQPPHPAAGRTARLAAHLFLTFLQGWKMGRLLLA